MAEKLSKIFLLSILGLMLAAISYGQLTFHSFPIDQQIVGRDPITNEGIVNFSGEIDTTGFPYETIMTEIYRNGKLHKIQQDSLTYAGALGSFNVNIPIKAELANYDFKVFARFQDCLTLEKTVTGIVAGDAYIIQGQSNAVAGVFNGTANWNQSNFIRVYSTGTTDSSLLVGNDDWHIGNGDLNIAANGGTGQWGLRFAKLLVDSLQIPIAVFNGAHSAKEIAFFQAPTNYKTSLSSNYGRLYYRLEKAQLRNHVRGVLWAQGEADGCCGAPTNLSTAQYISKFDSLRNQWLIDYPNVKQFYIFQTKNGCGLKLHKIKEAQRQLAEQNSDISIMATAQITHFIDGCHFPYTNGYELFGNRIFPLILEDVYGIQSVTEIRPPMITSAVLTDSTTLVITTDAVSLSLDTAAQDFQLEDADTATITSISLSGNQIILNLSDYPGDTAAISYLAQASDPGNFVENTNGLELICFYKYPLDTSLVVGTKPAAAGLNIYPNPSKGMIKVTLPGRKVNATAVITDVMGRTISKTEISSSRFKMQLPEARGVYNLTIVDENGVLHSRKLLKE